MDWGDRLFKTKFYWFFLECLHPRFFYGFFSIKVTCLFFRSTRNMAVLIYCIHVLSIQSSPHQPMTSYRPTHFKQMIYVKLKKKHKMEFYCILSFVVMKASSLVFIFPLDVMLRDRILLFLSACETTTTLGSFNWVLTVERFRQWHGDLCTCSLVLVIAKDGNNPRLFRI